jgi:pimeloyl-ACP methyl ester carboxylesterase
VITAPGSPPMPHVAGMTHRTVEAAGIRFHVAEAGQGDPVVLLHGWPQHWFVWRKVAPLLASDRRVICPDLRGFGWTDAPPGRYEKRTFAEDTLALLDALELGEVDLIAHDWGAWAGFLLALDHPERIRHYLALNILTPWPARPAPRAVLDLLRLWYQVVISTPGLIHLLLRRTDFVRRIITADAVHRDAWTDEELEAFESVLREPARINASMRLYRTFLLRELGPFLAGKYRGRRLTVPTLLIHGTHDLALDYRRLGDWKRWADDMAVEHRHDSGHFIAEELPEVVAARARALFDGRTARSVAGVG